MPQLWLITPVKDSLWQEFFYFENPCQTNGFGRGFSVKFTFRNFNVFVETHCMRHLVLFIQLKVAEDLINSIK